MWRRDLLEVATGDRNPLMQTLPRAGPYASTVPPHNFAMAYVWVYSVRPILLVRTKME
jgi:hypothetical protein